MTIERVVNGVVYEFPVGTAPEVIERFIAKKQAEGSASATPQMANTAAPAVRPKGLSGNLSGAALQGLTMGFSDELLARLRSAAGQGSYEDLVKAERESLRQYGEERPVVSTLAELFGGVAPAIFTGGTGALPAVRTALPRVAEYLAGSSPSLARMMGYGAASGAASAIGTSEKPLSEAPGEALKGAAAGATATGALGLAGKYVANPLFQGLKRSLGFGDTNKMADIAIAKALEKDGLTVEQAAARLQAVARNEMTLADLGENTAALLRKATAAPGQARIATKSELVARETGRIPRVSEDLRSLMSGSRDFYTDVTTLIKKRADDAEQLYKAAWNSGAVFDARTAPEIAKLRDTPSFKEAMKGGARRMADQGLDITDPRNTLRALHETKIELDDMIERALTSERTANQARILQDMKSRLLKDMEKASPEYRIAREAFAGDSEMLTAMKEGQRIYQLSEPEVRKLQARFGSNPSEYDAFRAGMAQAMLERLRTAGPSADPSKAILSRDMDDRLRRAFRDDDAYDEFKRRLSEESRMLSTEKAGFRRTPKDADLDASGASGVGAATRLMTGSPVGAAIEALQAAAPRVTGMAPNLAQSVAGKLITPVTQIDPVLDSIMTSLRQQEAALTAASMGANIGSAAVGAQAGSRSPKAQYPEGEMPDEGGGTTAPMPQGGLPQGLPGAPRPVQVE